MTSHSRPRSQRNAALQFYIALSTCLKIKLFHEFQFYNKKSMLPTKEGEKYGNTLLHSSNIAYTYDTLYCRMQYSIYNEVIQLATSLFVLTFQTK